MGGESAQVDPAAIQFDTRKTINQKQGGAALEHRVRRRAAAARRRATAASGSIRQYLAFSGAALTSSGGVIDLDRNFGGVGARIVWRGACARRARSPSRSAPTTTAARDAQGLRQQQRRSSATCAATRTTRCAATDVYAQAEWQLSRAVVADGGRPHEHACATSPTITTSPRRIPTTAAASSFSDTSPVLGVVFHATDDLNVYASYGEGFETPTFAELAYRPGGTGLNFALQPATSRADRNRRQVSRSAIGIASMRRCSTSTRRTRSSSMRRPAAARRSRMRARRSGAASKPRGTAATAAACSPTSR